MDMTKYVIKTNKPLSDLDDDEMLHLLIVPAGIKSAVYATKLVRCRIGSGGRRC
jgi:hypothetical protein